MIKYRTDKRFKFMILFMCILMVLMSAVPMITGLDKANATNEITLYFDTSSCPSTAVQGWSNSMTNVYYGQLTSKPVDNQDYYYTFSENNKMTEDTTVSIVKGTTGKMFKVTIDLDDGAYISFSPWSGQQKGTTSYPIMTYPEFKLSAALNNKVIYFQNTTVGDRFQKVWYTDLKTATTYENRSFKIANMTDDDMSFKLLYSNGIAAENYAQTTSQITARSTGVSFNVPVNNTATKTPFTSLQISRATDDVVLKTYVFEQGKILDQTFYYGVSQFQNTKTELDYGDNKTLCFRGNDFSSVVSVTKKFYFQKDSFPAGSTISLKTNDGTYATSAVTTAGNANYVTNSAITIDNGEVFSVIVTTGGVTDTYNLYMENTTDNLIIINENVASVSGEYTVQSLDNTYNGQKYITIKTDMYDYQYDDFKYKYNGDYKDGNGNKASNDGSWGSGYDSEKGKAKRPYVAVNTALSKSAYGSSTSYPMYLGQFWLPINSSLGYDNSDKLYSSSTLKQRAGSNVNSDQYRYWHNNSDGGLQSGGNSGGNNDTEFAAYFGFGDILNNFHWKPNLAMRTSDQAAGTYRPYDAVVQGLVSQNLSNGKLMDPSGTQSIPYFDETWWTGTETSKMGDGWNDSRNGNSDPSQTFNKADYMIPYNNLPFPFFEIDASEISYKNDYSSDHLLTDNGDDYSGKYYLFDSQKHSVKVDTANNKLDITGNTGTALVYDNYGDGVNTNSQPGFFPFNSTAESNTENLHYGFGVAFSMEFYLTENGTINDESDGTAITFTFQGDDDVWVFLDNKLILDMGGGHKNAIGEINFKNKSTFIGSGTSVTNSPDSLTSSGESLITKTFEQLGFTANDLKTGKHKIAMYYLERGMLNSNLYVMFNLPMSLTKWELQEDTSFDGVNQGFVNATKVVADNDVFNYEITNKGTLPANVVGSSYKSKTIDNILRQHNVNGTSCNTTLATGTTPTIGTTNQTVTKPGRIYIQTSSNWEVDDAKFAAIMKDSTGNHKLYAPFKWDQDVSKWYVDYNQNYNSTIKLLRINPNASVRKYCVDLVYEASESQMKLYDNDLVWTTINDFSLSPYSSNNTIVISGWDTVSWSNTQQTKSVPNYAAYYHTYDYVPGNDPDETYPVESEDESHNKVGVTYALTDGYAAKEVVYDSRKYGNTGNNNVISMQYSEMASLSRQFVKGSTIGVVQKDELSSPESNSRYSTYDDTNNDDSRKVSKYYTMYSLPTGLDTTKKKYYAGVYDGSDVANISFDHVVDMYDSVTNYANDKIVYMQSDGNSTTHSFTDPTNASNEYVHLRQVIVNEVKTAKLTISKDFLTTESDNTTSFDFTIVFNNIFGANTTALNDASKALIDYSSIVYTKTENNSIVTSNNPLSRSSSATFGTFSLKAGEYIEIEGIPVGTKFYITETQNSTSQYELAENYSINLGTSSSPIEVDSDTNAIVYNRRKTGSFKLYKYVYTQDETAQVASDTTEFDAVVSFTAPKGVNLNEYDIRASGLNLTLDSNNMVTVKIKHNQVTQITGLPYGTSYSVAESDPPAGYAKFTSFVLSSGFTKDPADGNIEYKMSDKTIHGTNDTNGYDGVVNVYNKLNPIVMPETGGTPLIYLFPFGIIAIALSGAALVIYKKKLQGASFFVKRKGRSD